MFSIGPNKHKPSPSYAERHLDPDASRDARTTRSSQSYHLVRELYVFSLKNHQNAIITILAIRQTHRQTKTQQILKIFGFWAHV